MQAERNMLRRVLSASFVLLCAFGAAARAAPSTAVASRAELQKAVQNGAAHIVLTKHIDTRDQEDLSDDSFYKFKVDIKPGTLSITGQCEEPPSQQMESWSPNQCVLTFGAMSGFRQASQVGPALLLDNLYILMTEPEVPREHRWAMHFPGGRPLYIRDITINGNKSLEGSSYDQALRIGSEDGTEASTGAIAERLRVVNYHSGLASPIAIYDATKLVDSAFIGNEVHTHYRDAPGAIYLEYSRAGLILERCSFENNRGWGMSSAFDIAAISNVTKVYSDEPSLDYVVYNNPSKFAQALPLEDAPASGFLSFEDEQFIAIQSQVAEAPRPSLLHADALTPKQSHQHTDWIIGSVVGLVAVATGCAAAGLVVWLRYQTRRVSPLPTHSLQHQNHHDPAASRRRPAPPLEAQVPSSMHHPSDFVTMTEWRSGSSHLGPRYPSVGVRIVEKKLSTATARTMSIVSVKSDKTFRDPVALSHSLILQPCSSAISAHLERALSVKPPSIEDLEDALDSMHAYRQLLAGRWELLNALHRRVGGQGIVQFVRDVRSGEPFVVKLFLDVYAFRREAELYANPEVREMMAAVVDLQSNSEGEVVAPNGVQLPPFIVLEKGRSLNEWALITEPDYITSVQVLLQIVKRLQRLHAKDLVHRDIKPANILWRSTAGTWTLIDYGCAALAGRDVSVAASIPYAPPEVALALKEKRSTMTADTSMDIWSLGVVIYELLVGERAFPGMSVLEILDELTSPAPLPWEQGSARAGNMKKLGLVKRVVQLCLSRDPQSRPSAESLLQSMDSLFCSATTLHQTDASPASPCCSADDDPSCLV